MTDLDTKAIRERAEAQVREYARLAQLRIDRKVSHAGDALHGLALGGVDGGEADITASGLRVVLDALDAARAERDAARKDAIETGGEALRCANRILALEREHDAARAELAQAEKYRLRTEERLVRMDWLEERLAQAEQEKAMLREALKKCRNALCVSTSPLPEDRQTILAAVGSANAALDGTKETA